MSENRARRASADDEKLLGIELLRFICALAVLVFHYQHLSFIGTQQAGFDLTGQPFYPLLSLFYRYGFHGVQVFWCISGFIFFWKYGRVIAEKRLGGRAFFVLRLSRLYPLHLATLLFMAAMQIVYFKEHHAYYVYANNDLYHFGLQLFMASNWGFQVGDSFNGPIWSISIEVLIYCAFFLTLRYISGSPRVVALMAAVSAAIVFFKISAHPAFSCAMFFYIGCLTAIVYAAVRNAPSRKRLLCIASLGAIVGLSALQFLIVVKPMYFLLVFSPALIFLCTAYIKPAKRGAGLLMAAGNVTYSSYLLHVPIQISLMLIFGWAHRAVPFYEPAFFLAFMAFTLLLSHWCYQYFEVPAQNKLRRKFMPATAGSRAVAELRP